MRNLPALAARNAAIAPFQTMELLKRADALAAHGEPIIHMSIGEPDFTAAPAVVQALELAARSGLSQYTAAVGIAPLREAIARYYLDEFGLTIDPARIIVTAGASAALSLACCALINPGDALLLTDPGYPCNRHIVAAFGGVAQAVPVNAATRFQLSARLVEQHWRNDTRGVLLATPSNPTGTSVAFDELGAILKMVERRGGVAMVDEIYLSLSYGDRVRSALELSDRIVVTNSFSKFFGMTGWRLGWLVVPQEWVGAFEKLAQNLYICASALGQHAALACFEPESMALMRARRAELRQRRDFLVPALEKLGFVIPTHPDGAFYIYADCSRFSADSGRFALDLLEHARVGVVPGHDFGVNQPERYLRFSYATALAQIQQAVSRIDTYLFNASLRPD